MLISVFVGNTYGQKKRIGSLWAIFFCCFALLPGIIIIALSPPINKLPEPNYKDENTNKTVGFISLFFAVLYIYKIFTTDEVTRYFSNESVEKEILILAFLLGLSAFFFTRLSRHKKAWSKINNI